MKYLAIKTAPPYRTLLGTAPSKTTTEEVEAENAKDAADAADAPIVGTKIAVVKLDDVSFFERTSIVRSEERRQS